MPRKNSKPMSDPGIAKIGKAPKGKRKELFDALAPGLCLRVTESGTKTWSCYYRLHGTNKRHTIGPWPAIKVAEARDRAREVKEQARAGVDPKTVVDAARDSAKAKAETAEHTTFGIIAELYIRRECCDENNQPKRLKRGPAYAAVIRRELIPQWKDRQIAELRRGDLTIITDAIIDSGRPAAALRVFEITKTLFNWAADRGDIEMSAFAAMRPPVSKVARDRVLTDTEIPLVWHGADALEYPFGTLVKLLLLTGQRRDEVAGMSWSEIDLEKKEWVIPARRSKSQREHSVFLSSLAMEILESLPRFTQGDYLLTTTGGQKPSSGFSKGKARLDTKMLEIQQEDDEAAEPIPAWRFHDLRRTCRTGLAMLGCSEIVSERILNHAPKGLSGVYNRFQYADEKRGGLERWARHVAGLLTPPPPNVVALRPAQSA